MDDRTAAAAGTGSGPSRADEWSVQPPEGSAERAPNVRVHEGGPGEVADHKHDIFFAAIETTRMPMLVTDPRQPDNPIVFANRAFLTMTGYGEEEIVGRNCRFLQGPDTNRETVSRIREAVLEGREITTELLNYRKDGSSFWNALFISPVYNRHGEQVYCFASQLDVSRRRDAEEALAQAQKMEALGQLTGGIAHDFNNLLQVMSGHLDVIRRRLTREPAAAALPPDIDHGLDRIRGAVAKASALTQQLLAFSRKQSLQGRVVNLNNVTSGLADLAHRTLGETVQVAFELAPDTPNCEVDPTQLEVAILNLLVNARDAMPGGGLIRMRTSRVEISDADRSSHQGLRTGTYATIAVTDDGTGIDPSIIDRVMDPFFTTKDEGKGTGLGLSMVYGFAKQSGGAAMVYSELGVGTTVRMFFPAVGPAANPAPAPERAPAERGGHEVILVVEDRREVRELAREMLESLGYRVHVAAHAEAALALVDRLPQDELPELLFSDVVMPGGMNGHGLAQTLQRRIAGLQVLLTTGFDRDAADAANAGRGEYEVLMKPYRLSDLARRVRQVLDGATGSRP